MPDALEYFCCQVRQDLVALWINDVVLWSDRYAKELTNL